jgi:putative lipase involved disintegration of autophagic bodies
MLLPIPLVNLALSFLNGLFPPNVAQHPHVRPPPSNVLNFHLRHFHVATSSAHIYLSDVPHDLSPASSSAYSPLSIVTSPLRTTRPSSHDHFQAARHLSKRGQSTTLDWQEDEVPGPDVTRRETLLLLAKMTSNTYFEPGSGGWYNLTDEWNVVRHLLPRPARVHALCDFDGVG